MVITDDNGEIYSIEGLATDYEAIYAEDGYLVHTNHLAIFSMRSLSKVVDIPDFVTSTIGDSAVPVMDS